MPDSNPAAPTPPIPPTPPAPPNFPNLPNLESLSASEVAKVVKQFQDMAHQLEVQADKFEEEADKVEDRSPEQAKQLMDASRQWNARSKAIETQADKMAATARKTSESTTPLFDQGGVSVVEQDGRTVIKKDGKTIVDVPSKSRDRSSRTGQNNDIDHGVAIVFIVFLFLFLIIKAIMGPVHARRSAKLPGAGPGLSTEDSATLQRIHRTLGQMERRVEALETILADPRRTAAFTTVTRPTTTAANPSTSYESKV